MEFLVTLVVDVLGQVLVEAGLGAVGWLLAHRWGRVALGVLVGGGAGMIWSLTVAEAAPLLATAIVAVQVAAVPWLAGRRLGRRRIDRSAVVDAVLIGAAVVVGRWLGWLLAAGG
ncbi:MAG TPA: hypothetical protein VF743_09930 [Acidimicrobiales bacterium]